MNETPPPDVPDPASPPSAAPEPAKPRRVITRPDSVRKPRQPGTVITRPDAVGSPRLPGTYAANYGGDPNWKRGVTMLWVLFGLAALAEGFRALFIVLSGNPDWPVPSETARLCAEAVVFLLLWVGWSWPRWVLVAVDFLFGAWFLMRTINPMPLKFMGEHPAQPMSGIATIPQFALGMIYLASAGYLAFSADVIGFTRHRREAGRGWVVAPIALIVVAYVAFVCSLTPLCVGLFEKWRPEAGQFATEGIRAMAEHWDVAAYDQRADADYLKVWPEDQRKPTFGTLAGFGPIQTLAEVKTSEGRPSSSRTGGSFLVRYHCDFGTVKFAHGSMQYGCLVSRHILGPWRLENLEVGEVQFDPAPDAAAPPAAVVPPIPTVPPVP